MNIRQSLLCLALACALSARFAVAQNDGDAPQLEFCVEEDSNLHDEPCELSPHEGFLPVGTKLVYQEEPELPLGCDNQNWLPVFDSGIAKYIQFYGNCSNYEQLLAANEPSEGGGGISLTLLICSIIVAVTLVIVVPMFIVAIVVRKRMQNQRLRGSGAELRAMSGSTPKGSSHRAHRANSDVNRTRSSSRSAVTYPSPGASAGSYTNNVAPGVGWVNPSSSPASNALDPARQYATFQPQENAADQIYWGTDALIPYQQIKLEEEVGRGGFGKVYRGIYQGQTVAVKSMAEGLRDKDIADFRQEAKLLARMGKHPNVVTFIGLSLKNQQILMVMEFLPDGSLLNMIESNASYGREEILTWLRDISRGMLHLVQNSLIHRDLAARNILLADHKRTAKVTDFGMSREQKSTNTAHVTKCNVGPLKWMAPESLLDKMWSEKTDVWAFGVLMFEILAREEPYIDLEPVQVASQVCRDTIALEPPSQHGSDFLDLLKMCMQYEPHERYSFEQVLSQLNNMY